MSPRIHPKTKVHNIITIKEEIMRIYIIVISIRHYMYLNNIYVLWKLFKRFVLNYFCSIHTI